MPWHSAAKCQHQRLFRIPHTEAQAYGYNEGEPLGSAIAVVGPPGTRSCAVTVQAGRHEKTSLWTKSIVTIFRHITNQPLTRCSQRSQNLGSILVRKLDTSRKGSQKYSSMPTEYYSVELSRFGYGWSMNTGICPLGIIQHWLSLIQTQSIIMRVQGRARPVRQGVRSSHADEEVAVSVWTKRQVTSNSHDGRMLGCEYSQLCVNIERRNVPRSGKSTRLRCRSPGALLQLIESRTPGFILKCGLRGH